MGGKRVNWQALATERWLLYSHAGLLLIDDFTGLAPKYPIHASLEYQDGTAWLPRDKAAVVTPGGIISYPALGRGINASTQAMLRHRVT